MLSDFAATTPAAAGAHIADELRMRRASLQEIAQLRTQNDELRMHLHHAQIQMQHATQPVTPPPVSPQQAAPSQTTALRLVLTLLIGMVVGVILLLWFLHRR